MQRLSIILVILAILAAGCGKEEAPQADEQKGSQSEETVLYVNPEQGIEITNGEGWTKKEEISEPFNVRFENEKATVIITMISNKKSVDEIKDELISGAGEVTILEEEDHSVSFQTKRKESIRSDVFIERSDEESRVIIFMTPAGEYENNKAKFDEFKENIHFE
ncbi:hypothetical protein ACFOZY_10820 [Chungangia koreensis]|uniref:PsbP protein n=1 Tax=Chungangia koreensis TaxID=752657 RepID=A0ABV8X6Z5_9LACT